MRAGLLALLEHGDRHLTKPLGHLRVLLEQLAEANRASQAGRARADDEDADLDPLVRRVGRLGDVVARGERRREVRGPRHQPRRWRTSSVSLGTISCTSPTTPRSLNSKIGAFASLLIATIVPELCMPTLCWIAPEMPRATYSFGETVLPVWPIWAEYGYQPASTTARVAATAPPSAPASSSASLKLSASPSPRPPPTRMSASSMLTSSPRCSPRLTIFAFVDHPESSTSTSTTSAEPPSRSAASKALRRPMMMPGSPA